MIRGGKLFNELRGEPIHVKMVYTIASALANVRDSEWKGIRIKRGEFVTSLAHLAEYASTTIKQTRFALRRLEELGVLKTSSQDRRFTRIALLTRGTDLGIDLGTAKPTKTRIKSKSRGTDLGTDLGNSLGVGVTAVRRSPGVDVSYSVQEEVKTESPPFHRNVHKSKSTSKARYGEAVARAPDLPAVVMHVDRLFAEISNKQKYPWVANPWASTTLADLIVSHGAPLVMTAAERFFVRGNKWIEQRAWAIDELALQFARLISLDGATKRAAEIRALLAEGHKPRTHRELQADQAAQRRRAEQSFDDSYDPAEVRFGEEFRAMRQKVVT